MNDDHLNALLRVTREEIPSLPASFQREVWQRIAVRKERNQWFPAFLAWISRPLPAAAAWSLAVLCGMFLGFLRTDAAPTADKAAAYAQSINPLAKMHSP